jgi:hypothetical protein
MGDISVNDRRYELACARIRRLEKHIDTVSSPMWKRIVFVIQGYRFRQLGVWYHASWNKDGWEYDDNRPR